MAATRRHPEWAVLTYESAGLSLAYSAVGEGSPVVFVHGATASGVFEWGRLAEQLAVHHRCVMPDLRGHARSEFHPESLSREEICRDLWRLIEHLELGQPHIVGFSYGAETALTLELDRPGAARSLVLVSPGTGRPADYAMPSLEGMQRSWPESLRRLHVERHGAEHWRDLLALLQQDSAARPELTVAQLGAVACPVLLVSGTEDEATRRQQAARFARANPRARHVEFTGAGHAVHHQRFADTTASIANFLHSVDLTWAMSGSVATSHGCE